MGEADQMSTNLVMLGTVLAPRSAVAPPERAGLLQGTKAYGVHVRPVRVPGRERDPHDDVSWLQQDHLRGRGRHGRAPARPARPDRAV